ncbi:MAG TPA: tetratricopeptide repeat protein [Thermoanaerobaculia bacterium]
MLLCAGCASQSTPPAAVPDSEQYLPPDVEAMSLLGKPLHPPQLSSDVQKQREDALANAMRELEAERIDPGAAVTVSDRLADLGRYREAIDLLSDWIHAHPNDARLYLARGHRFINVRRFSAAVNDLQSASLLDRHNRDILYHLGLAHYLLGEFDQALAAYTQCLRLSTAPDDLVATSNWMYMTLRRLGSQQEADKLLEPISIDLDVKQNVAYHKLLLMYGGEIAPEELARQDVNTTDGATLLYGVGNWRYVSGRTDSALPMWREILDGNQSFSFGYIAAEAEVARLDKRQASRGQ